MLQLRLMVPLCRHTRYFGSDMAKKGGTIDTRWGHLSGGKLWKGPDEGQIFGIDAELGFNSYYMGPTWRVTRFPFFAGITERCSDFLWELSFEYNRKTPIDKGCCSEWKDCNTELIRSAGKLLINLEWFLTQYKILDVIE